MLVDIGLSVNTRKTMHMEIRSNRGMIAGGHITIGNNSYKNVKPINYLGSLFAKQNYIHQEIKCRLKAELLLLLLLLLLFGPNTFLCSLFFPRIKNTQWYCQLYIVLKHVLTVRELCRRRVFENMILRRIFGPRRGDNGELRRLHSEDLHTFYRSPNTVWMTKSRILRWAGHVARMEEGNFKRYTHRKQILMKA